MPGFIKVSGEQRPVAVPYIKVSGDWKPVAIGWVKVNGEWKIWHTAEIVDNFNRTDSPTLGLASNDFTEWGTLAGSWEINTNKARAGSTAGPHLASVPLYKANTNVTVEVDIPTGTGVGAAFWVKDATNWWAAIPGRRTQSNPSYYYCADGSYSLNGQQCIRTTFEDIVIVSPTSYTQAATSFQESFRYCDVGTLNQFNNCVYTESIPATESSSTSYSCPSGYSGPSATNRCSTPRYKVFQTNTVNYGCLEIGACAALGSCSPSQCPSGFCKCTGTTTSCTGCGPDFNLSCANCSGNHIIFATATTTTTYSCPATYTRSGTTCSRQVTSSSLTGTRTVYGCPDAAGYTKSLSGSTCTYTAVAPYCPSGFIRNSAPIGSGNECQKTEYQSAIFVPASTSYPSVIRVQRSVGGVITTQFQNDIASDPRSIRVTTSGNNVNVRSYALAGVTGTPYSSLTYTTSNASKSTDVGVIKNGNQAVSQGNDIDNFRAE